MVYLDHNSTTPVWPEAIQGALNAFKEWGNPSSVHQNAAGAKALLWQARQHLARLIACHPLEIIFTSGASESNNQAIKGLCHNPDNQKNEVIFSAVEHPSLTAQVGFLKDQGFKVHYVPVSREGQLNEDDFDKVLSEKTLLVSIMLANNETGLIYPVKALAQKSRARGAFFHSDMVQGLGKLPIDIRDMGVDMASFSGHKFHSLKGSGFLYCQRDVPLRSLIQGGPQERKRRAGTENLPGIAALGAVAEVFVARKRLMAQKNRQIQQLRDEMEKQLLKEIPRLQIIGRSSDRLNNTSLLIIPGLQAESLLINLDLKGFSVSAGSACHSGKVSASPVLTAMGFSEAESRSSLRVSLGYETTASELSDFAETLKKSVRKLRSLN